MNKIIFLLLLILWGSPLRSQTFSDLISRLNSLPEPQRQAVADSFMNAGHSFPYTEFDTLVHFVYNSAAQSVAMAGDATGWNPNKAFTHISGSNFWYYSTYYEADARLDYKFVINGSSWILDPKNQHTCAGGFGPNSELRMPAYVVPPEISFIYTIPHGTLKDTVFSSYILGNSRLVRVYLPPGYPSGSDAYPVILFHDGPDYLSLGNTNNILDYLIAEHLMVPAICIFVPAVDRTAEYAGNKIVQFTNFIVTELMPVMDARYKTSRDPARRAMTGASDGGNISLYIGMKHPELFGKIAAQSSDVIPEISNTFTNGPKLNLELYIDIGTYDIAVLIPMVHGLRDILQTKGYTYQFHEWHEGHSWGNWKGHLRLPLLQFFPITGGVNDTPGKHGFKLEQNRPNPFHGDTRIPFIAPIGSNVELTVTDMAGKTMETIFTGKVTSTKNVIEYHHKKPTGEFIITLRHGSTIKDSIIIHAL
jgi:enterochelin esterase-like enzyme